MAAAVASDLGLPHVGGQVALGGDVGEIHHIEIDELQSWRADGGQLQGHLAADGAHADHRGLDVRQPVLGHQVLLPLKTVCGQTTWLAP